MENTTNLDEQENLIRAGILQIGKALERIQLESLYRERGYTDFEQYCKSVWNWSLNYVNRLIRASTLAERLSTVMELPKNVKEAHLRTLANSLPNLEQQATALALAFRYAEDNSEAMETIHLTSGVEITSQVFATGIPATFQEAVLVADNPLVQLAMVEEVRERVLRQEQHRRDNQSKLVDERLYDQLPPDVLLGYANYKAKVRAYENGTIVIIVEGSKR